MPRKKKFDRSVQLEQAMHLFWQKGFADTSLVDIERALKVKAPSIYATFGSKEKLFLESIGHYIQVVVESRIQTYLLEAPDPLTGIREFLISGMGDPDKSAPGLGCLLTNSAAEFGTSKSEVADKIKNGLDRIRDAFEAALLQVTSDQQSASKMAATLLIDFQGLMLLSKIKYDRASLITAIDHAIKNLK
ncbi:MAG: TetR/AcrR family transcriptional regulator [Rhodothermaceae bacterium]|nr:TetR/AcrR family transcriptional regulator [Rhodothermaceae bacterium]